MEIKTRFDDMCDGEQALNHSINLKNPNFKYREDIDQSSHRYLVVDCHLAMPGQTATNKLEVDLASNLMD